jgi:hypothetical protein
MVGTIKNTTSILISNFHPASPPAASSITGQAYVLVPSVLASIYLRSASYSFKAMAIKSFLSIRSDIKFPGSDLGIMKYSFEVMYSFISRPQMVQAAFYKFSDYRIYITSFTTHCCCRHPFPVASPAFRSRPPVNSSVRFRAKATHGCGLKPALGPEWTVCSFWHLI